MNVNDIKWKMTVLAPDIEILPFECADKDLNEFLQNDAKNYLNSLLATTYIIQNEEDTIAYFCISHDSLNKKDEEAAKWNKINRSIPNDKRRRTYPAVKIGRLAVATKYEGYGFGRLALKAVVMMYANEQQRAGCRFVTVDAYRSALAFYEKNDFRYLTEKDKDEETRAMYFDLKSI
ncbi:MAG: GNAT family N-acetyltransferase [Prevotellaceae bacterium]|jgi:GNAT superfamily N-acetyltransferase|nr:GNAT family N-acetyltransferase [Prevotellaceae bacterium]